MANDALRRATPDEQFEEITRGTVDLHVAEELKSKLRRSYEKGQPLSIKTGFDPNRPDLHLGHSLLLTRMRRFQEFGHQVVFLIGDRKSTRLNSSHSSISYAVFCLKKKKKKRSN